MDSTTEELEVSGKEVGNQELAQALTAEGGPLQAGLMPATGASNEEKTLEALCEDKMVKAKEKVPKANKTERLEPKTFAESGTQMMAARNNYTVVE